MKANANQIRAALDAPSPDIRLYLLHGPDEAGARALADRLARAMGPDAERVDLDGAGLKADPARLAEAAASMALFGGAQHIRVSGAGEESLEAIELLLAAERAGNPVVMLAPTVKATGKVFKLATAATAALVAPCYPPEGADADRLVAAIGREVGLRIRTDIARELMAASGNDRAVLTRELEKLALYLDAAPERPRELSAAAIEAVGADAGEAALGLAIEAVLHGELDTVRHELAGLDEAGTSVVPLLRALVRRLMLLAEMRAELDRGGSIAALLQRVFWKERDSTVALARRWSPARIATAIDRARGAERETMAAANAGAVIAYAQLITIARQAAR